MSEFGNTWIEVYSHFFRILNPTYELQNHIHKFVKPLIVFERVKPVGEPARFMPTKVFSSRTENRQEYRLHINQFQEFIDYLKSLYVPVEQIPVYYKELYTPELLRQPTHITKELRDYQHEVKDFALSQEPPYRARLIGLPTGTGKTFTSLYILNELKQRTIFLLLPIYIDKWVQDIQENLGVDPKNILVVQGAKHLMGLIEMAKNNQLQHDYIIISTITMRLYIEDYDANQADCEDMYGCVPFDLYRLVKAGLVIIDETHQHIHAIFKIMLQMHVPMLLSLTATLLSEQSVVKKVYDIMFPKNVRYDKLLMKRYIDLTAVGYYINQRYVKHIRTSDFGSNTYSQSAFEKSIMRIGPAKKNFFSMIEFFIRNKYERQYQSKDKCIVFVGTKAIGALLVDYLKQAFPGRDVRRYMEDDPYENCQESDIIVSTIVSAGTAVDIPQLTTVIMTVSISSPIANAQSLGRLREIPGREVHFVYFYSYDLEKQMKNHYVRKDLFQDRTKTMKDITYSEFI